MSRLLSLLLVPALALTVTGPARAELITITLGGATFSAAADTVTLTPRTFALDLTPDVPLNALLQSGAFSVGDSGGVAQNFPGTLSRTVTVGGASGTLSQPLNLSIMPDADSLRVFEGATTTLNVGMLRQLAITPLARPTNVARSSEGTTPFDLQGAFRLINVPEPGTLALSVVMFAGLYSLIRRRAPA